jgi:phosphoheptose isomerase
MNLDKFKKHLDTIPEYSEKLKDIIDKYDKIIILGNGGSHSVAEHIAQDYVSKLKKECLTFSNLSHLTAYTNDYGWEETYRTFLTEFSDEDTLVILISSSGASMNIVKCALDCRHKKIPFITLSGFNKYNKLRRIADSDIGGALLDFWVDEREYLTVEIIHLILLHSIIEENNE